MNSIKLLIISLTMIGTVACTKNEMKPEKKSSLKLDISKVVNAVGIDTLQTLTIAIDPNNSNGSKCQRIGPIDQNLNDKFPFNLVRLCRVKTVNGNSTISYYSNQTDITETTDGNVMVEIPKIYYLRTKYENIEYISISNKPIKGYKIDPAFLENGKELNHIYIGVYQGTVINNKLRSLTNKKPTSHYSLNDYRIFAQNNGKGYGLFDARSLFLIQKLFMIYFADRNTQEALGYGLTNFYWQTQSSTLAINSEAQTNKINIRLNGIDERYYKINQIVAVAPKGEYSLNQNRIITDLTPLKDNKVEITFSGAPVDVLAGISRIYGQPQKTGLTDNINQLNNNSTYFGGNYKTGTEAVKFLYLENLWGNLWTMIDGFFIKNLTPYIGENMLEYDSQNIDNLFEKLDYSLPLQNLNKQDKEEENIAYIAEMGLDKEHSAYAIPSKIGQTASPTSGYSDPLYTYNSEGVKYFAAYGGGFDHSYRAGLFSIRIWWQPNQSNSNLHGSRLQFKNLNL